MFDDTISLIANQHFFAFNFIFNVSNITYEFNILQIAYFVQSTKGADRTENATSCL